MNTLAFIGGGNMARSLIGGLVASGTAPEHIVVADPVASQVQSLQRDYAVRGATDNQAAVQGASAVILAVKPQQLRTVVQGLQPALGARTLLISIAAGIRAADIARWAGSSPVVRCMPNRPALEGCGITALFAMPNATGDDRNTAETIMRAVGATLWVERESDMDAVTAISGSGPAYFFLLMEMLEQAGVELGLSPTVSRQLAIETAYGSGRMARSATDSPLQLRQQVTSKGGTTQAALEHLEAKHIRAIFVPAVKAAAQRSAQLAEEFGKDS